MYYICSYPNAKNMQYYAALLLFFCTAVLSAQPRTELTPSGFTVVQNSTPALGPEKLIELSNAWATYYNKKGADVFNVSANALTIEAMRENAFFYRNLGEIYQHDIRYALAIEFGPDNIYTMRFTVKEIYIDNVLLPTSMADYFLADGTPKEDFEDVKPSIELSANNILKSFAAFIER